ncbi:MAG: Fis family transcriptional regulator [Pseudomonadales bacterium]|nr:Fis family transcriptional regulator [Pseudomonadales bacterium]
MTAFQVAISEEEYIEPEVINETSESLADFVVKAVSSYMDTMDDQQVTNLYQLVLSEMEAPLLRHVLKRTNNNQSQTALILGLNRGTLRKKLEKYGLL